MDKIRERTKIISIIKLVFLFSALTLLGLLFVFPLLNPVNEEFKVDFTSVELERNSDGKIEEKMSNPRFEGVDSNNQPYVITADYAIRDREDSAILYRVKGDINLKDGKWLSLSSDNARYHMEDRIVELFGNVQVFTDEGYECKTEYAKIISKESSVYGKQAVTAQGPLGNLRADSFEIYNKGDKIKFVGNVKLVFYPNTKG